MLGGWNKPLYKNGVLICIVLPLLLLGVAWEGRKDLRETGLTRDLIPWTFLLYPTMQALFMASLGHTHLTTLHH